MNSTYWIVWINNGGEIGTYVKFKDKKAVLRDPKNLQFEPQMANTF